MSDFVIENGALKKYNGPGGAVVIPEGVTSIGDEAFYWCSSLTSVVISEGVTSIGNNAFRWCDSLTSVEIPSSVTRIGDGAFRDCKGLTSVVIPEGVTSIGDGAFCGCKGLTSVVIPEGVTSIGDEAFYWCSRLTSVEIPSSVTSIGSGAFEVCSSLISVSLPNGLLECCEGAFANCSCDVKIEWKQIQKITGSMAELLTRNKPSADEMAFLMISQTRKAWKEAITDKLNQYDDVESVFAVCADMLGQMKKITATAGECLAGYIINCADRLSRETVCRIYNLLKDKKSPAISLLEMNAKTALTISSGDEKQLRSSERIVMENLEYNETVQTLIRKLKHGVKYKDSEDICNPDAVAFIIERNECSWGKSDPLADEVAADLDRNELNSLLMTLLDDKSWFRYLKGFCRYATDSGIIELTDRVKRRMPHYNEMFEALMYSDTRTAVAYLSNQNSFFLERYAKMRGTTADELRLNFLCEWNLDENDSKIFDLGDKKVKLTLNEDFTVSLTEEESGKALRTMPKKAADADKLTAATEDYKSIKNSVKQISKSLSDTILSDFRSGKEQTADDWKRHYEANPLYRIAAKLIVWDQDGKRFISQKGKYADVDGTEYRLNDRPVKVAHPMELSVAETEAWRQYLASNGIKQPFAQMWEMVIPKEAIKPDRYEGIKLPVKYLSSQSRHGIHYSRGYDYTSLSFEGCYLDYEFDWDDEDVVFQSLSYEKYTRQLNHILNILDRMTIRGRIEKDDVSIADRIEGYNIAQISDFINLAIDSNAVNVKALLLDYKQKNFAEYDAISEFTLDD